MFFVQILIGEPIMRDESLFFIVDSLLIHVTTHQLLPSFQPTTTVRFSSVTIEVFLYALVDSRMQNNRHGEDERS